MSLQQKLDARRTEFESKAPKEAVQIMHRATDDLRASGIADRALKVGDIAPDFTLKSAKGQMLALKDLLARGPVVLNFYRGKW